VKRRLLVLAFLGGPVAGLGSAEAPGDDPLADSLFPPELVMQFQAEIGLTAEQRDSLQAEMEKAGPRFEDLHRRLQEEAEKLGQLLRKERVDQAAALSQLDKVHDLQREIQRAHLALVIGLKNQLTSEQQSRLVDLRRRLIAGSGKKESPAAPEPEEKGERRASFDSIRAEVESLRAPRVAWREISWNSCLLEGLKESREMKKPLLLWVFIDRPADDARC
jgi:Spy/CpxP family protein refolding chaperone